jgi:organic radical activating enzyme
MFGQNPIRSADADPNRISVQSAFYTIQGEGPQAGRPALFVRLAGCNLACWFCDTEFEKPTFNGAPQDLAACLERDFSPQQRELVVLTGGEPLRQQGALLLIAHLLAAGTKLVQIETAGTLWLQGLERYVEEGLVQIVCSPKTPRININIAVYCQHWKYIVRSGEASHFDGLPRRGTQLATKDKLSELFRPRPVDGKWSSPYTIWLSPCDEQDPAKNAANAHEAALLCMKYGYRLSIQMHKLVGVE